MFLVVYIGLCAIVAYAFFLYFPAAALPLETTVMFGSVDPGLATACSVVSRTKPLRSGHTVSDKSWNWDTTSTEASKSISKSSSGGTSKHNNDLAGATSPSSGGRPAAVENASSDSREELSSTEDGDGKTRTGKQQSGTILGENQIPLLVDVEDEGGPNLPPQNEGMVRTVGFSVTAFLAGIMGGKFAM